MEYFYDGVWVENWQICAQLYDRKHNITLSTDHTFYEMEKNDH